MKHILTLIALFVASSVVLADPGFGPYEARFISIYDADTFTLEYTVPVGIPFSKGLLMEQSVRLYGLDTPEKSWRAKCEDERNRAISASVFVENLLVNAKSIKITIPAKKDKFGRLLALVVIDGKDLTETLVSKGFARRYYGGTKSTWCDR
jgi:endonuclease YncB( thermonuclease family)